MVKGFTANLFVLNTDFITGAFGDKWENRDKDKLNCTLNMTEEIKDEIMDKCNYTETKNK